MSPCKPTVRKASVCRPAGSRPFSRTLHAALPGSGVRAGAAGAGAAARLARYIGYYRPYATSHEELDHDAAVRQEACNVARALATFLPRLRRGELAGMDRGIHDPRPK